MVFFQSVLEAVVAVADGAVDAGDKARSDDRLAAVVGARLLGDEIAHPLALAGRVTRQVGLAFSLGPRALVRAFVSRLGSVVKTEGLAAGLAEEGEEVELVAIFELAVGTDEGGVATRAGVYRGSHFDVAGFV